MKTTHLMTRATRQSGFGLIELMIALMLGLIVIGGATAVFLSNKQSYRSNDALSQVQENSRIAFELIARDVRQTGLTGCGNLGRVANVLNNGPNAGGTVDWYANFGNALIGYEGDEDDPAVTTGTGTAQRVAGTDSLELVGLDDSGLSVASHNPNAANFKLNETSADLASGDIIVVCDPDHAVITQITNYNSNNVTLVHNTGTGTPGNCSKGLGFPTQCTTNGNSYQFGPNSQIAKLAAIDWYIGNNPLGGRSLYRIGLLNSGGVPTPTPQEMIRNVDDMQIQYHQPSSASYVDADAVVAGTWTTVDAIRLTLQFRSTAQFAGTDAQPIVRNMTTTITLRNRVR
jgi:type IV pilus assembly protein PilW